LNIQRLKSKKTKIVLLLLASFVTFITFSSSYTSKEKTVNILKEAYEYQDVTLLRIVLTEDDNKLYSDRELEAFLDYLNSYTFERNNSNFMHLLDTFATNGSLDNPAFSINKIYKSGFIKKYVFDIKPIEVTIVPSEHVERIEWYGDVVNVNKKITMLPSYLSFDVYVKSSYGEFMEKQLMTIDNNQTVNVSSVRYINVTSNFHDATIYIDGKDTGLQVGKEGQKIGPLPFDGSITVSIKNQFPWGEVKSKDLPIYTRDYHIELDPTNAEVEKQLTQVVEEYVNSVVEAWKKEDATKLKHVLQEMVYSEQNLMKLYDMPRDAKLESLSIENISVISDANFAGIDIGASVSTEELYEYEGDTIFRQELYYLIYKEEKWVLVDLGKPLYTHIKDQLATHN
jgi:hypothetical protein